MARINRIRVVNFNYNGGERLIPDFRVDTKEKHVMLNLHNGGGKSALVQMINQVILPLSDLGSNKDKDKSRKFKDVFSNKKEPAYILIEWKLDNNDYVTTGIALKRKQNVSTVEGEDEIYNKNNFDYYTFVLEYTDQGYNDIYSLPLIDQSNGKLKVRSFQDVRSYIESIDVNNHYRRKLYKAKSEPYAEKLKEIGINKNFWRGVLNEVNSHEGGLEKVFEDSRTSSLLIKNWFLPEISRKLEEKGIHTQNTLIDQIFDHIKSSRRKMDSKKFKIQMEEYLANMQSLDKDVKSVMTYEKRKDSMISDIFDIYYTFNMHIEAKTDELNLKEVELNNVLLGLDKLDIEEICKEYYEIKAKRNDKEIQSKEIDNEFMQLEDAKKELCLKMDSLNVARINQDISRKQKELAPIEINIQKLQQDQDELQKQKENLGYTIYQICKKELDTFGKNREALCKELKLLEEERQGNNEQKKALLDKKTLLSNQLYVIEDRISLAEKYIAEFSAKYNYSAGLFGLEESILLGDISSVEIAIESISNEINKLSREYDNFILEKENCEKQIELLKEDQNSKEKILIKYENNLQSFIDVRKKLNKKLALYHLVLNSSKDKEGIIHNLNDELAKVNASIDIYKKEMYRIDDELMTLEHGGISIDESFLERLELEKIHYNIGSEYIKNLKHLSQEEKKLLVENNRLLPYAVIMKQQDIDYIANNLEDFYNSQLILMLAREELENINERMLSGCSGVTFLTNVNKDLLVKANIEEYKNELVNKKNSMSIELEQWNKMTMDILVAISDVDSFDYEIDFESNALNDIQDIKSQIKQCGELKEIEYFKIEKVKASLKKCNELSEDLKQEKEGLKQKEVDLKSAVRVLIEKNENEKMQTEKEKEILNISSRINTLENVLESKMRQIESSKISFVAIKRGIEELEEIVLQYGVYEKGEVVEGSKDYLLAAYMEIDRALGSANIDILRKQQESIQRELKTLEELKNKYVDYYNISYSKSDLDEVESRLIMVENSLQLKRTEVAVIKAEIKSEINNEAKVLKKLGDKELVSEDTITANIPAKREHLRVKKSDLEKQKDSIIKEMGVFKELVNKIEGQRLDESKYNELSREEVLDYLENPEEVYSEIIDEFKAAEMEFKESQEKLEKAYQFILDIDIDENSIIDRSIKSLKNIRKSERLDIKRLSDTIERQITGIVMAINKQNEDLKSLDKEREYIYDSMKMLSRTYFEELNKMDSNSTLNVNGNSVRMMRMKKVVPNEINDMNIKVYLNNQLERFETLDFEDEKEKDLRKKVREAFNIFKILNTFHSLDQIAIEFLKVEKHYSRKIYKKWEEVISLSGGEKFLSFFVLFSSIHEYSKADGFGVSKESLAMIMDNPFSAISSKHLLDPLFDFADKKGIQLICFTDHDKKDILDVFDVFYKLNTVPLVDGTTKLEVENCDIKEELVYGSYSYQERTLFDM